MIKISLSAFAEPFSIVFAWSMASEMLEAMTGPSGLNDSFRVTTMFVRFGKILPIDSKVFLPMITGWPVVSFLKRLRSSEMGNKSLPPFPMARCLSVIAATMLIRVIGVIRAGIDTTTL